MREQGREAAAVALAEKSPRPIQVAEAAAEPTASVWSQVLPVHIPTQWELVVRVAQPVIGWAGLVLRALFTWRNSNG